MKSFIDRASRDSRVASILLSYRPFHHSAVSMKRHSGSSFQTKQKRRQNLSLRKKKKVDPKLDRKGKLHSEPGMRIKARNEEAHLLEASLRSDRHPAMWNDPFYTSLYEELMAPTEHPQFEGGLHNYKLLGCPDELRAQLEAQASERKFLVSRNRHQQRQLLQLSTSAAASVAGNGADELAEATAKHTTATTTPRQVLQGGSRAGNTDLQEFVAALEAKGRVGGNEGGAGAEAAGDDTSGSGGGAFLGDFFKLAVSPQAPPSASPFSFLEQTEETAVEGFGDAFHPSSASLVPPAHAADEDHGENDDHDFGDEPNEEEFASAMAKMMSSLTGDDGASASALGTAFPFAALDAPVPPAVPRQDWLKLLRVYGAQGRAQDAINCAESLERKRLLPSPRSEDVYCALVAACGDGKRADLAEALFDQLRLDLNLRSKPNGVTSSSSSSSNLAQTPSLHTWSALVNAQVRCGRLSSAFAIFERMQRDGVAPDVVAYTSLLHGVCHLVPNREKAFEQANDLWFNMRLKGVGPNEVAYTAMMRCCFKGRMVERAINLLEEMKQEPGLQPSVVTYNVLLKGIASVAPQWHRANALLTDQVLDWMQGDEVKPDGETFEALLRACASVGDVVSAEEYWRTMTAPPQTFGSEVELYGGGARAGVRGGKDGRFGYGLTPTDAHFAAMLECYGNAQCLTYERHMKRYLTQPRGWPRVPNLGPRDELTPVDKVKDLSWDPVAAANPNIKFRGFDKQGKEQIVNELMELARDTTSLDEGDDDEDEDEDYDYGDVNEEEEEGVDGGEDTGSEYGDDFDDQEEEEEEVDRFAGGRQDEADDAFVAASWEKLSSPSMSKSLAAQGGPFGSALAKERSDYHNDLALDDPTDEDDYDTRHLLGSGGGTGKLIGKGGGGTSTGFNEKELMLPGRGGSGEGRRELEGLSWKDSLEKKREAAAVIIAKGEKKAAARERTSLLGLGSGLLLEGDGYDDGYGGEGSQSSTGEKTKKNRHNRKEGNEVSGFMGAASIEEEWGHLVRSVYKEMSEEQTLHPSGLVVATEGGEEGGPVRYVDAESLQRLKEEVEQLPPPPQQARQAQLPLLSHGDGGEEEEEEEEEGGEGSDSVWGDDFFGLGGGAGGGGGGLAAQSQVVVAPSVGWMAKKDQAAMGLPATTAGAGAGGGFSEGAGGWDLEALGGAGGGGVSDSGSGLIDGDYGSISDLVGGGLTSGGSGVLEGLPMISTQQLLDFDWSAAEAALPHRGPRYLPLPRVRDQMEAAKEYSRLTPESTEQRQTSNLAAADLLFEEYLNTKALEKRAQRSDATAPAAVAERRACARVLDAKLSVYSKALRYDDAVAFVGEHYFDQADSDNQALEADGLDKAALHLVEMFVRANQLGKAFKVKDGEFFKQQQRQGCSEVTDGGFERFAGEGGGLALDQRGGGAVGVVKWECRSAEVYGALVRKLADCDRLQEAVALLEEAHDSHGLVLRERNVRELRLRLSRSRLPAHPLLGADPEQWRKDAKRERSSKTKDKMGRKLRNMMVGH